MQQVDLLHFSVLRRCTRRTRPCCLLRSNLSECGTQLSARAVLPKSQFSDRLIKQNDPAIILQTCVWQLFGSNPGLESRQYGRRDPSRWPRGTLYPQKLALTSPTSGGRSVGIVRSPTQATEFFFIRLQSLSDHFISWECLHCFLQSFQQNAWILSPVVQDSFLPNSFQFIVYLSHSHLTLCSSVTTSTIVQASGKIQARIP
jgi:hypothetical protein